MRHTFLSRCRALVLATVMVGSGVALPELDVALYHRDPGVTQVVGTRISADTAPVTHAERCILGLAEALRRPAERFDTTIRVSAPALDGGAPLRLDVPRPAPRSTQPPSRAPPIQAA